MHIVVMTSWALQKFVPLGHSPDEIELAMKQCNMHPSQALSAWDQNIK